MLSHHPRHPSLAVALSGLFLLLSFAASLVPAHAQVYKTIGPGLSNPDGVYLLFPELAANASAPRPNLPVITLLTTISCAGTYAYLCDPVVFFISFAIDVVNARGGILLAGQPHYLSYTYASDDSSAVLAGIIAETYVKNNIGNSSASPWLLLGPLFDAAYPEIVSRISSQNVVLWDSGGGNAPIVAEMNYPFMFVATSGSDGFCLSPVQLWFERVQSEQAAGTLPTPNSAISVCLLSNSEPYSTAMVSRVRDFLLARNVTLVADSTIVAGIDTLDFTSALMPCKTVDLLVIVTEVPEPTMLPAMRASQIQPKAAIVNQDLGSYDLSLPEYVEAIQPFLSFDFIDRDNLANATLPWTLANDVVTLNAMFSTWAGQPTPWALSTYASWLDILFSTLSTTRSLNSTDMRQAWLSLNGTSSSNQPTHIDPISGMNTGFRTVPTAFDGASANLVRVIRSKDDFTFPAVWPWPLSLAQGDTIQASFDSTGVVLAAVVSVLGVWVAQILLEQAAFTYRQGSWLYVVWILAVSVSLGLVGIWAALVAQLGFLGIVAQFTTLSIHYSLNVVLLALLPSLFLTFAGLNVLILQVERRATTTRVQSLQVHERSAATDQALEIRRLQKLEQRAKQEQAMIDLGEHVLYVARQLGVHSVVAGVFIAAAIIVTRFTLFNAVLTDATWSTSSGQFVLADVLAGVFCVASMHWSMHALRLRSVGGFAFMGAVLLELNVWFGGTTFKWAGVGGSSFDTSTMRYSGIALSTVAMKLLAGIFAAVTCLGFIAVQFSRMQLSRNDLALLTARLERSLHTVKRQLRSAVSLNSVLAGRAQRFATMVDLVNLLQPHHPDTVVISSSFFATLCLGAPRTVLPKVETKRASNGDDEQDETSKSDGAASDDRSDLGNADGEARSALRRSSKIAPLALGISGAIPARPSTISVKPQLQHPPSQTNVDSSISCSETSAEHDEHGPSPEIATTTTTLAVPHRQSMQQQPQSSAIAARLGSTTSLTGIVKTVDGVEAFAGESDLISTVIVGSSASIPAPATDVMMDAEVTGASTATAAPTSSKRAELVELLAHPVCVELFKAHLVRLHSDESLTFYLAIEKYRLLPTRRVRKTACVRLIEMFVRDGSPFEINVSQAMRLRLAKDGRSSGAVELFDAAQQECLLLMETNAWPTFVTSNAFAVCKVILRELPVPSERTDGAERLSLVMDGAEMVERDSLVDAVSNFAPSSTK